MRKFIIVFLSCFFLILYCNILCRAENKEEIKTYPSPDDAQKMQQRSMMHQVTPVPVSVVSPTFTPPHMTVPQIMPQAINPVIQANRINSPTMQNIPMPTYIAPQIAPVSLDTPQPSVIGNTVGKVVNLGSEKDGLWMEVNDDLFGEVIKVKIKNLKNIPIVRQAQIYSFKDIKIGDTVNAMFHTEGNDNVANFINVLSEEEIEMMKQSPSEPQAPVEKEGAELPQQ
jgi:hypothetical protein